MEEEKRGGKEGDGQVQMPTSLDIAVIDSPIKPALFRHRLPFDVPHIQAAKHSVLVSCDLVEASLSSVCLMDVAERVKACSADWKHYHSGLIALANASVNVLRR